jgi:phosphoserine phosphatase
MCPVESHEEYGWRTMPDDLRGLPIVFVDVDGTVRGDVVPMVKLARPLVPNVLHKVAFKEPFNFHKFLHFTWNLGKLWTLRTVYNEHRRRYKHLFSELHHLAAALLHNTPLEQVRATYRRRLPQMQALWFDSAVTLLRRLTRGAVVVLVTGSEQLQTEECVRLLGERGVDVRRILVCGSLYGFDSATQRFTGKVNHLNVTLDGKRDVITCYADGPSTPVAAALGNSRPDRALFESVSPGGLNILVCAQSVVQRRDERTFVIRKYRRSGFRIVWDAEDYLSAARQHREACGEGEPTPILATDRTFSQVLTSMPLRREYENLLGEFSSRPRVPVGSELPWRQTATSA